MSLDLSKPLDRKALHGKAADLDDLQGNILKPHGRWRAAHCFVKFDGNKPSQARALVAGLAEVVTSAKSQTAQSEDAKESRANSSNEPLIGLWLSAEGFRVLGLEKNLPADEAFCEGMSKRSGRIGDTRTDAWQDHLRDPHALLLIASDSDDCIDQARKKLLPQDKPNDVELMVVDERGQELVEKGKPRVEPFGFRDGLRNPEMVGPTKGWGPSDASSPYFPLKQVLEEFAGGYGSYFVFRKLEQNVDLFNSNVKKLACAIKGSSTPTEDEIEYAAALVMGRFRNGTDLLIQGSAGKKRVPAPRDSSYADDSTGSKCPFQAHIRRANRRGELNAAVVDHRSQLIVRRGMPYLQPVGPSGSRDRLETGTLFICCQGSIKNQFEVIQGYWLNASEGPGKKDAVAGQGDHIKQTWPTAWKSSERRPFLFQNCIAVKGGEYFFAPPISFLKGLA